MVARNDLPWGVVALATAEIAKGMKVELGTAAWRWIPDGSTDEGGRVKRTSNQGRRFVSSDASTVMRYGNIGS